MRLSLRSALPPESGLFKGGLGSSRIPQKTRFLLDPSRSRPGGRPTAPIGRAHAQAMWACARRKKNGGLLIKIKSYRDQGCSVAEAVVGRSAQNSIERGQHRRRAMGWLARSGQRDWIGGLCRPRRPPAPPAWRPTSAAACRALVEGCAMFDAIRSPETTDSRDESAPDHVISPVRIILAGKYERRRRDEKRENN